jgi:hypothetical protein
MIFAVACSTALVLGAVTLPRAWTTPPLWAVLALLAAFLLTESVQLDIEFRRQTFSVSPSEVALVVGLVEVGGVWTAAARVAAVAVVLARQSLPLPKIGFNLSLVVVEGCRRWTSTSRSTGCPWCSPWWAPPS